MAPLRDLQRSFHRLWRTRKQAALRGFLVELTPADFLRVVAPVRVDVAIDTRSAG